MKEKESDKVTWLQVSNEWRITLKTDPKSLDNANDDDY